MAKAVFEGKFVALSALLVNKNNENKVLTSKI